MGLFKKRHHNVPKNTLSQQINAFINICQRKLADYLNVKTRRLSNITLLLGLIIFCALFGSYLLYLLMSAFGAFN
ncbi:MAG: hypothetical protein EOO46_00505 [Flavobacterium sp.]|nr:MAG: hypothetical protein EOO46_00505 [Flavobacterium sp.]